MDTHQHENEIFLVVQKFRRLPDTATRLAAMGAWAQSILFLDRTDTNLQLFADLITMLADEYENERRMEDN